MKLNLMNKKQTKEILALIKKQFDADTNFENYAFFMSEKDKVYIINRDIDMIDFQSLRIDNIGMYLAHVKDNKIRLSIEGSQLIGQSAKKNVYELNESESKQWIMGEDIETENDSEEFVLIKHNNDFFGTGKIKNKKILNFVTKGRRLKIVA